MMLNFCKKLFHEFYSFLRGEDTLHKLNEMMVSDQQLICEPQLTKTLFHLYVMTPLMVWPREQGSKGEGKLGSWHAEDNFVTMQMMTFF